MDTRNRKKTSSKLSTSEINRRLAELEGVPLVNHVHYFGGDRPKGEGISYSSMVTRNENLGNSWFDARATAFRVSAGAGTLIHRCPFSTFKPKEVVGVLNHSHHTGIYNLDGTFNVELWNELCTYSEENNDGVEILTENQFYAFLTARRKQEDSSDIFGELASNGEWNAYWETFSYRTDEKGTKYVTLEELLDFYLDSSKPGLEVEQRVKFGM